MTMHADDFEKAGRDDIEKTLDFFQQKNMVSLKDKKLYVFIDEVQNVKGWQQLLKTYYDFQETRPIAS